MSGANVETPDRKTCQGEGAVRGVWIPVPHREEYVPASESEAPGTGQETAINSTCFFALANVVIGTRARATV